MKQGFIKFILLIIILVVLLVYLDVDIKSVVDYVWNAIEYLWNLIVEGLDKLKQ